MNLIERSTPRGKQHRARLHFMSISVAWVASCDVRAHPAQKDFKKRNCSRKLDAPQDVVLPCSREIRLFEADPFASFVLGLLKAFEAPALEFRKAYACKSLKHFEKRTPHALLRSCAPFRQVILFVWQAPNLSKKLRRHQLCHSRGCSGEVTARRHAPRVCLRHGALQNLHPYDLLLRI